jgi:hypothetical protein
MTACFVTLPYATFDIRIKQGKIVNAPSIAKWMIGKTLLEVRSWVKEKKGMVEIIK